MGNGSISHFFGVAVQAIREEDEFIRRYLLQFLNAGYCGWSAGIACLFETGIAYTIIRRLWSSNYPRAIGWEIGYPNWVSNKVDLALYHQTPDATLGDCHPEHVIEIKRFFADRNLATQKAIWWDIFKLFWFPSPVKRYLLLLTFGSKTSGVAQDVQDLLAMRLGPKHEQYTPLRLVQEIVTGETQYQADYVRHLAAGVEEIAWEEFDTNLKQHGDGGIARISLVLVAGGT